MSSITKNPRIILWLVFVVVAVFLISPNPNANGFVVKNVAADSPAGTISVGDIIYSINGKDVVAGDFLKSYTGIITISTNRGDRFVSTNGTLGISASSVDPTKLKFGLDIKGGVRAVLAPEKNDPETINQVISTLQSRINFYGLRESVFRAVSYEGNNFVEVSIAEGTTSELRNLIESQGKFEAKIPLTLSVSGGQASIDLEKLHQISVSNSSIALEGSTAGVNQTVVVDSVELTLDAIEPSNINVTLVVFTGNDIVTVYFDPQRSRIESSGNGYRWSFGIHLSTHGAENFARITKNAVALPTGYLNVPIEFYLDGELVDSLSIASSLKGEAATEISLSGPAPTLEEATRVKTHLQSVLRSGALPTAVEIVELDTISPTLGSGFLKNSALAGVVALLGVIALVSVRYRKPKLVLPMVLISVSEIMIVVGLSVVIGWTIDLAAIAGLIASVGTGISDQIIILDRALRKEEDESSTIHQKVKKAFFVVFGTAGTVIAAMLPLLFTGFGILRGFALITIIGVLVGILITRPAYGVIVEKLTKE